MTNDSALYESYLSGDTSAGDALMLRYADALVTYLDGFLHNAQDAEDLMLDCFSVVLVKKPRIAEGCFRAYLFRMARYKAIHLWKLRLRREEFSLDESLATRDAPPEDAVWTIERNATLRQCLNRIAPQYREALWLVYDMGMSYAQAAEVMRCREKRIDNLLSNGKRKLREALQREGITHADI